MDDISKIVVAFFGGIITVAIVSVIVSRKSQAPQAISAIGGAVSRVVAAAVNPVSQAYGYGNGSQTNTNGGSGPFGTLTGNNPFGMSLNQFLGASQ